MDEQSKAVIQQLTEVLDSLDDSHMDNTAQIAVLMMVAASTLYPPPDGVDPLQMLEIGLRHQAAQAQQQLDERLEKALSEFKRMAEPFRQDYIARTST